MVVAAEALVRRAVAEPVVLVVEVTAEVQQAGQMGLKILEVVGEEVPMVVIKLAETAAPVS